MSHDCSLFLIAISPGLRTKIGNIYQRRTLKLEYTEENISCNEGKVINVTVYNILVINELHYQNSIASLNLTKKSKIIELV